MCANSWVFSKKIYFAENTHLTPEKHVFSKRIIKLQNNATKEFHWFEHTHVPKP
jgi:hypothetical protein